MDLPTGLRRLTMTLEGQWVGYCCKSLHASPKLIPFTFRACAPAEEGRRLGSGTAARSSCVAANPFVEGVWLLQAVGVLHRTAAGDVWGIESGRCATRCSSGLRS